MLKKIIQLSCISLLMFVGSSWAWWATGHEIITRLAFNNLALKANVKVNALTHAPLDWPKATAMPEYAHLPKVLAHDLNAPILASTWPDFVEFYEWNDQTENRAYANLHFTNVPITEKDRANCPGLSYWQKGVKEAVARDRGDDVVQGIRSSIKTLVSHESRSKKAIAMRYLLHLVGDVHMPFHVGNPLFTYDGYTFSTEGANGIDVTADMPNYPLPGLAATSPVTRFHAFWDGAVAAYLNLLGPADSPYEDAPWEKIWSRPDYRKDYMDYIKDEARIVQTVCRYDVDAQRDADVVDWAAESAQTACKLISSLDFQPYATGNPRFPYAVRLLNFDVSRYEAATQSVALHRVCLAGYRLGNLLNAIYAPYSVKTKKVYRDYVNGIKKDDTVVPLDQLIHSIVYQKKAVT